MREMLLSAVATTCIAASAFAADLAARATPSTTPRAARTRPACGRRPRRASSSVSRSRLPREVCSSHRKDDHMPRALRDVDRLQSLKMAESIRVIAAPAPLLR